MPRTLVPDNLRAAVKKADWFDPDLNPKIEAFCRHYGTVILPTRPRTPRHKGKVERGIDYVQDNGLKARQFDNLAQQNAHLLNWETTIADTRIHGTTRQQVGKVFREVERAALQKLPLEAASHGLTHAEFLELILQDELAIRADRLIERRVKIAAFRELKTIDQFDFAFNPSIKKQQIYELAND